MIDTARMVPTTEGDRVGRPWVELWGNWLHGVDVSERMLALPLGDMGSTRLDLP